MFPASRIGTATLGLIMHLQIDLEPRWNRGHGMQNVKVRVNEHYGDTLLPLEFPDGWKPNLTEMACKGAPPMTDERAPTASPSRRGARRAV